MTRILIGEFMKFKPLHDRVLIEVLDGSEKTAGGIIIPDTAQEKTTRRQGNSSWWRGKNRRW